MFEICKSYIALRLHLIEQNRVRIGTTFAKWGKLNKFLLNGVIIVTNDNLEGKK
jgi:hypothetical protein